MARRVLNVGGNNKDIPLPPQYAGWEHVLLDIDPRGKPDVLCDARELTRLPGGTYDSIYCSHNLEHYHRHEVGRVVAGFFHLLKSDGFAFVRVPDMGEVMQTVVKQNLDIDDVLYQSPAGPILVRDVIYGYGKEIQDSGNDFYAHKTGFTDRSLRVVLLAGGFSTVFVGTGNLEVTAVAVKDKPSPYVLALFDLDYERQAPAGRRR
jgi:hypothetical protein